VFERVRDWLLRFLRVPPEPEAPFGAPSSLRVFRASRRLYWLRLIRWSAAQAVALAGIVAMPATFLIMSGQVDLSVGGAAAFAGIVLAATAPGLGLPAAVLLAAGSSLLIGIGNGLLVTSGRVDSIAATFATMALLRGLAYLVPGGLAIALAGYRSLGDTRPFPGIALPTLIFGAVTTSKHNVQFLRERTKLTNLSFADGDSFAHRNVWAIERTA